MNLNEAFRYQNFLNELLDSANTVLIKKENTMRITKKHLRNAANPDAADEEEVVDKPVNCPDINKVVNMIVDIIDERELVSKAIHDAKDSIDFDYDVALEVNRTRRLGAGNIDFLLSHSKAETEKTRGNGYRFNVNGDQMPYYYDIEITREEDFDRCSIKELCKRLKNEADDVSEKINKANVNTEFVFVPRFDIRETPEEIMLAL